MNTETKKGTIKRTVDVKVTLLAIPSGGYIIIKTRDAKANAVRACVSRLNAEGHSFETTEKGFVDEIKVTRNK